MLLKVLIYLKGREKENTHSLPSAGSIPNGHEGQAVPSEEPEAWSLITQVAGLCEQSCSPRPGSSELDCKAEQ